MAYSVLLKSSAEKSLKKQPRPAQVRLIEAINKLGANPRPPGVTKLQGDGNLWRICVGPYRVVYEIHDDKLIVLVVRIGDRKDIYR